MDIQGELNATKAAASELKEAVAALSERIDLRMNAFQRTQNLTNRLLVTLIGLTGATAVTMMYAALTR